MSRVQCHTCLSDSAELNSARWHSERSAVRPATMYSTSTKLRISDHSVHLQVSTDLQAVGQWTDFTNSTVALSPYAGDHRLMSYSYFWSKIGFEVHKAILKWKKLYQCPTYPLSPNVAPNTVNVFTVFVFPFLWYRLVEGWGNWGMEEIA